MTEKIATLLAVEDDSTHQYVLKRFCENFEYELHIVPTGEEALKIFEGGNYAAVLMDLWLPGMDGLECARQIRAFEQRTKRTQVPLIALTVSAELRQACFEAGMNDYLTKPFDPEDLRKVLLRWVYQPERPNLKLLKAYFAPHSPTNEQS